MTACRVCHEDRIPDFITDRDVCRRCLARTTPAQRMAAKARAFEHPRHPHCTGLTATWCPVHGSCTCPLRYPDSSEPDAETERTLDDPGCRLHRQVVMT